MRPGQVVMELSRIGFSFRLDGEAVKVRFEGKQAPPGGGAASVGAGEGSQARSG